MVAKAYFIEELYHVSNRTEKTQARDDFHSASKAAERERQAAEQYNQTPNKTQDRVKQFTLNVQKVGGSGPICVARTVIPDGRENEGIEHVNLSSWQPCLWKFAVKIRMSVRGNISFLWGNHSGWMVTQAAHNAHEVVGHAYTDSLQTLLLHHRYVE